ncbi:MAG TPA: hypothetical protein VG734_02800 [Lacunisphaera sp.]|nr:hypothetical protein [Lacunisphaera sp.]
MSQFDHQWQRLTALARQAPANRDDATPAGFATRVAARAGALPAGTPWLSFERYALRGLLAAAICCIAAVAFNLSILSSEQADTFATGTTDTVVELLDLS